MDTLKIFSGRLEFHVQTLDFFILIESTVKYIRILPKINMIFQTEESQTFFCRLHSAFF